MVVVVDFETMVVDFGRVFVDCETVVVDFGRVFVDFGVIGSNSGIIILLVVFLIIPHHW